jgi:DNA-binding MarR family transcriptional regulator
MKPEETIDFHIRWSWSKISRAYNIEAAKYGGTMSIGYVLLNIEKDGTPSTKLGPKMGMESRSLTRTLKSMEDNGLIARVNDPNDKRMVRVLLTEKGKKERERARAVVLAFNTAVREKLSDEQLTHFFEVMNTMNALLEENHIFEEK